MELDTIMLLYARLIELETLMENADNDCKELTKAIKALCEIKSDTLEIVKEAIEKETR